MTKGCGCPYGCCSCGEVDDNKTDVYVDLETAEFFFLVEAASSMGPVGWEVFHNKLYLGKLGDDYLQDVGRRFLHEKEVVEFRKRNKRF